VQFFRMSELGNDPSNWFAPSLAALDGWVRSAGFIPVHLQAWPEPVPSRAMLNVTAAADPPEYLQLSYERPLRVVSLAQWESARSDL
jgi:hypothetical protein